MGYKYYDANGDFTNPADNPNLKYYRGDGVFAKADMDHKFYDATGDWSAPELTPPIPDSFATPQDLINAAAAAKSDPAGVYAALSNQLTPAISMGNYGSIQFRLVGTNHDNLADGSGKAGLSFLANAQLSQTSTMAPSNTNAGGYKQSATTMQTTLNNAFAAMDPEWSAVIKAVSKEYGTSVSAKSTMVFNNLWIPSWAEVGWISDVKSYSPQEGETYEYFKDIVDVVNTKRWFAGPSSLYWCRSGSFNNTTYFGLVFSSGNWNYYSASNSLGVVVGFCV